MSSHSSDCELGLGPAAPGLKLRSRPSCQDLAAVAAEWRRPAPGEGADKPAAGSSGGGGAPSRSSPRAGSAAAAVPVALRRSWRRVLSAVLGLALLLVLVAQRRSLYRRGQDAYARAYYGLNPLFLGRSEAAFPAPRCCVDEGCAAGPGARVAVVTYLRDDSYAPLMQQLECTLRRSNPDLELALMTVAGELSEDTLALARRLNITLLPVEPLQFPNTYDPRYGRNWVKLRALGLTQYHSVLLVDADVAVTGALGPLFGMPTEFAAVWDQSKWLNRHRTALEKINGGVLLLRPCAAVEAHMLGLVAQRPQLRFTHGTAEQDFFSWYYRYTGSTLPLQWNCMNADCLVGNTTVGGAQPRIVHMIKDKPFHGPQPGGSGHQFLCSMDELHRRSLMAGLEPSPPEQQQAPATDPAAAAATLGGGGQPQQQQEQQQQQDQQQQQPALEEAQQQAELAPTADGGT